MFVNVMLGMIGISMLFLVVDFLMGIDFIQSSRTTTVYDLEYSIPENGVWYDGMFVSVPRNVTTETKISTWDWIYKNLGESK